MYKRWYHHLEVLVVVVVVVLCCCCYGMILKFTGENNPESSVVRVNSTLKFWTSMYSPMESPSGQDQPVVGIDLSFERGLTGKNGTLDVLIYPLRYSEYLGIPREDHTLSYCCTPDLNAIHQCKEVGVFLLQPNDHISHFIVSLQTNNASTSITNLRKQVMIALSDYYYLQITNCQGSVLGDVTITGMAYWKNAYGYLPAETFMLLPVNGFLASLYLILIIFFLVLCIKYFQILMKIQWGIFGVLLFCLIETASWCFYRVVINNSGYYSLSALLFVVFLANVKKTVARVLVLLVCMGLGIVKWTLGTTKIKVGLLAAFYMFFCLLYQTIQEVESLEKKEIVSEWVSLVVVIPTALLETVFYYWIILSIIRTMQQLTLRRQILKLQMYKSFFAILVVSGVLACIVVLFEGYIKIIPKKKPMPWQNLWIVQTFWEVLFFAVMASNAILWRPRENNTRYGYAEFFTNESQQTENNIETLTIGGETEVTRRKKKEQMQKQQQQQQFQRQQIQQPTQEKYDSDREKNIQKTKLSIGELERDIIPFDLADDDQEDIDTHVKKMD